MKKVFIILLIVLVIVVGAVYLIISQNKKSPYSTTAPVAPVNNSPAPEAPVVEAPTSTPAETTVAKTFNIEIASFSFQPQTQEINRGDTVVWTNQDSAPHQIFSNEIAGNVINKGQTFSFTFNNSGDYDYTCKIHPSMKGVVVVK